MMSSIPAKLEKMSKEELKKEILRIGMIAELDAVSLYEQLAAMTDDKDIQAVLMDIAKEEKTHMGEFEAMLLRHDKQQVKGTGRGEERSQKTDKIEFSELKCQL